MLRSDRRACNALRMANNQVEVVPVWDLPDRMRKALRHAGVEVQEMAEYLDVSRSTVSNWINGRIGPSTQTLRLWAMRTGVPYAWLKDGSEVRTREFLHAAPLELAA